MLAIFLYLAVTIALIVLWRRFVQPLGVAAAIVLVLLPLCFTGRALLTGKVYGPIDLPFNSEPLRDYAAEFDVDDQHSGWLSDLYMQMIPWQSAVRQSWAAGEWPLWNRYILAGSMLAPNMQSAPYDPLNLLALLLPQAQALTFGAAMSFFLAGFFTFAFARALGCSEVAALIAAAGYMFSAMLAFFIGWPLGRAWALLPLVMLGVRLIVREPGLRAAVLLTTGFVTAIFAGHPESVLHIVAIGAIYGVYELATHRANSRRAIGLAVLSGVIALLLTAIALLPFLMAAPETYQYHIRHELFGPNDLEIAPHVTPNRIMLSLLPWWGGRPELKSMTPEWEPTTIRVGSIVLALALAALVLAPRRDTWFFFGAAIVVIWIGLDAWPLAHWLHELPLFRIALNERLAFAGAFALAILAALAVDAWPSSRTSALRGTAVVVLVGVALAIFGWLVRDAQIAAGVDRTIIHTFMLAELIPLALIAALLAARVPRSVALPLILGALLLQRTLEDGSIYPAIPEKAFYPSIPILRHMQADTAEPFRMIGLHYAFLPGAATLYGLEDARGYEAMTFTRLVVTYPLWSHQLGAWFNRIHDKSSPFLSFLNVKYAIGSENEQPDEQWKLVLEDRNSRLFENTRVLPRVFIPPSIRYERNEGVILEQMKKATDFSRLAWITAPDTRPHEVGNGPGTLQVRRRGGDYEIEADMVADGWIIISDALWPGWRVYIDGKRIQPHYANVAFLGVLVTAGKHHVRIVYMPESFTRGRNITFATIAGLILFFAFRRYRLKKPRAV